MPAFKNRSADSTFLGKIKQISHLANSQFITQCQLCQSHIALSAECLCKACKDDLAPNIKVHSLPEFDVISLYAYDWPVDRLIMRFKAEQHLAHLPVLSQLMVTGFKQAIEQQLLPLNFDAILAVPLANERLIERGFNQSLLLSQSIAQVTNRPIWQGVSRQRNTLQQKQLKRYQRLDNLAQAFQINDTNLPKRMLIIDDVITTGSTLKELSAVLLNAGVQQVSALVLARAENHLLI